MAATALPRAPLATTQVPVRAHPERVRLGVFAALGLFAGLHWGALIHPAQGGDMFLSLLIAMAGGGLLIALPTGWPEWQRRTAAGVVAFVLLILALLVAGVPLRMLGWRHWDDLVSGMWQGISSTPAITVPYRGIDEWVRTAIMSGGTALLALAALLAFWPRRGTTPGYPLAAAVALGVLYAVPVIEHGPDSPYFDGALFFILLAGFLWLEHVRSDQMGVATACVVATAIVGAVIAPHLDSTRPWFNYENFAEKLEPTKAEAFSWTHSYGPLRWSRDGRELLRIKATVPAYWKAINLDDFDGVRWREGAPSRDAVIQPRQNRKWVQTIKVVDRGLRSTQFVGAGNVEDILPGASRLALPQSDGTFVTSTKPLRPGDSYQALVYVPHPTDTQLKRVSPNYPGYTQDFLEMHVPLRGSSAGLVDQVTGKPLGPNADVRFAPYGTDGAAGVVWPSGFGVQQNGDRVMADSPYAQLYALTQQIRRSTKTPYDFVQAVLDRVQSGTTYDENPPQRPYPLAAFLFDTKTGYCQQFSGVMALMLRMGGVPARVASGFSPGSYNSERKDYVVRDTDAHSWVEAYFPPYGWITFDPTPAASPATSQLDDTGTSPNGGPTLPPNFGGRLGQSGDRPFAPGDPGAGVAPTSGGGGWKVPAGAALVALMALLGAFTLWRRRTPFATLAPEVAELQRALHRSGRDPSPDVTLARLESVLGGSDAAAAYIRAVRDRRYARSTAPPTAAQRRALRRQLGSGLGLRGALRAWWALPPLPRGALKDRLRRPYTPK
ncbi:MAG TPA: transglutaminaseTgpA domain-containing protein [Solirubrobacteraceae bacterium]|nr:transglutaminaseTgpA domain-containing protein [Solirubrobacteraceae bacterium]